jgi:hypothetical protein
VTTLEKKSAAKSWSRKFDTWLFIFQWSAISATHRRCANPLLFFFFFFQTDTRTTKLSNCNFAAHDALKNQINLPGPHLKKKCCKKCNACVLRVRRQVCFGADLIKKKILIPKNYRIFS